MFLDDEIVQIAESRDWTHWSTREKVNYEILKVMSKRFTDIANNIKESRLSTDAELFIEIKRTKNAYNLALTRLKKKGIDLRLSWNEVIEVIFHESTFISKFQNV